MAKRKLNELFESRLSSPCGRQAILGKKVINHPLDHEAKKDRSFIGFLIGAEFVKLRDDFKKRRIHGFYSFFRTERCYKHFHWSGETPICSKPIDRSEAYIYYDALKAVVAEVCEMTLLCLWKRIGLDKHVVLGICRMLWWNKKEWMP